MQGLPVAHFQAEKWRGWILALNRLIINRIGIWTTLIKQWVYVVNYHMITDLSASA